MPIHTLVAWLAKQVNRVFKALLRPASAAPILNTLLDLSRRKPDLIAENALLRHQLALMMRQSKPPRLKSADRLKLLLLAKVTKTWRQVLLIVQPDTLLRWHREGFRLFMRFKQQQPKHQTRFSAEIIDLIRQMARENPLWGAERIRGELLKLGFSVAKRTVQRYMNPCPTIHTTGQAWRTFLKTHVGDIWSCDFVPVIDLFFQQLFVFFIIELHSRRVVHFNVTRHPNDFWVARQLQAATADAKKPKFIIRDNDQKFGNAFDAIAKQSGIEVIRTPIRTPTANAICERYIGSVRRECLNHILIFGERQLYRVIKAYVDYFNLARPHQGIEQHIPNAPLPNGDRPKRGKITGFPILNGLHHDYRHAA